MNFREWPPFFWAALWLLLMAVALTSRPMLPIDETRYLAVAWEMWRSADFLVPHLNGEAYSHKPPLLFWLIDLGWAVFGVNDWWPRLVAPFFGLASLLLTQRLAWRLWPNIGEAALMAPLMLFGSIYWVLFTTLTMFDMILAFCSLVGLLGILRAWRGDYIKGFVILGLGIGFGVLTKGPAILLHVLPVALSAPLWGRHILAEPQSTNWGRWYMGVVLALVLGVIIALAWAVPAAIRGGEAYANAIFWGQSAGRMVNSFAHGRPWWWYLAVLPPMLLPWLIWPTFWQATRKIKATMTDGGAMFCLLWFLPAFVVFSLISGKQPHYLLPDFPALALIFVFLLNKSKTLAPEDNANSGRDMMFPGLLFAVCGGVMIIAAQVAGPRLLSRMDVLPDVWWGLLPLLGGLAAVFAPPLPTRIRIASLASLSFLLVVSLHLALKPVLAASYDLKPLALRLAQFESQGYALAFFGKYHGQFHFPGRLETRIQPIGVVESDEKIWLAAHARGKVITYNKKRPTAATPDITSKFRGGYLIVWDKETIIAHPGIAERE